MLRFLNSVQQTNNHFPKEQITKYELETIIK